jgi:hypothetical protein
MQPLALWCPGLEGTASCCPTPALLPAPMSLTQYCSLHLCWSLVWLGTVVVPWPCCRQPAAACGYLLALLWLCTSTAAPVLPRLWTVWVLLAGLPSAACDFACCWTCAGELVQPGSAYAAVGGQGGCVQVTAQAVLVSLQHGNCCCAMDLRGNEPHQAGPTHWGFCIRMWCGCPAAVA